MLTSKKCCMICYQDSSHTRCLYSHSKLGRCYVSGCAQPCCLLSAGCLQDLHPLLIKHCAWAVTCCHEQAVECCLWAVQYIIRLLIELAAKGAVFSFPFFLYAVTSRLLRPGGLLCLVGLTYGDTWVSKLASGASVP